ncbi:MAG TPA: TrbI/VirB10 family protein [Verrucomicrobiae bacterium]|jgi:hypothetical protein
MSPRSALTFAKTPVGAFLSFCVAGVIALIFFKGCSPATSSLASLSLVSKVAAAAPGQTMQSIGNDNFSRFDVPPSNPKDKRPAQQLQPNGNSQRVQPEVLPLSLYAETPEAEPKELSKDYAPYGRLIPCELIVTVDSSTIRTPIIGLVTEDVYHQGRLIIRAGTEVHGMAQTDRVRERIASGNNWTLVWHSGEELKLSGIALDRETNPDGQGWGITDGSAGLRGRIIKTDDMAEIKLFAASFLSGAANLLAQRQQTFVGALGTASVGNAGLEGAQSVIGAYAQQIYQSIQQNGFYVRVAAGKQFYLYVTQTIDKADAVIGGTREDHADAEGITNQPNTVSLAPLNYATGWPTNTIYP